MRKVALVLGGWLLVGCGASDEAQEQTSVAVDEALSCGERVVGGIGYPVGNRNSYPAGGWQVWQVLAHHWPAWGGRHLAQDVSVSGGVGAINAPVYSMANGVVLYAKANASTYRNVVLIRHDLHNGQYVCSFFGHVNSPMVSAGQTVSRGQPIATVMDWALAAGGPSSNTHLHYVLLNKAYCDYAASTGTANWSGSGVCGYDHGGPNGVGWSDLSTEPPRYTPVSDSCGGWQFTDGLLSPSKYVEAQKQAAGQCSGGGSADVTVLDLWWSPSQPAVGDSVHLYAKVKNVGDATTGDIVGVGFKLDAVQYGQWWDTTSPLAPGQEHDFHMQATWQVGASGSYAVTAHADDIDRFAESNESNNVLTESLTVGSGGSFPCDPGKSNCCHYPPETAGLPETFPGGLCDPDGDGSYADADWVAGWHCYEDACGS